MEPETLGPFKIGRVLGRGGMGVVYEGTGEADRSTVAIKVLTNSLAGEDAEDRIRFESEIETLKRLRHPNIVRLTGFGEEQGRLYYVMELVDGSSLQQELKKKRFFRWHEAAKIGLDLCQALRHAHDRGVIHRDIKPANILLDKQGNVKLSDFGIARFFGSQQITDAHTIIGTLEYMSPEQALANPISSGSDLYSLGCVLYALLTSKPPFLARSLPELLRKHQSTPPAPIRSVRLDVPENLEYIVTDLLMIRPEARPRNALLVIKRLQSLLQALIGNPDEIQVLPMSLETPVWHDEPVSLSANGGYQPPIPGSVIDLGNVDKMETDTRGRILLPESEFSGSFRRAGHDRSIAEAPTVALSAPDVPGSSDSDKLQTSEASTLLADTVTTPALRRTGESPTANGPSEEPIRPPPKTTRFTAVGNTTFELFDEEKRSHPIVSLPTALTSIALMVVGLTIYYLLQPVPPEVLFRRITATVREEESADRYDPASLRSARKKIDHFLSEYSNHPLAEQVQVYQDALMLSEYERRLERRSLSGLSPVERIYVEILATSPHNPDHVIDKLHAFITVFQSAPSVSEGSALPHRFTSTPVEMCVELARQRLTKMEQEVAEINAAQKQVVRRRLDEAADWDDRNPEYAKGIRKGIIELYQHHRWAKELVDEAKQELEDGR